MSDDGDMDLGHPRGDPSESTEDKVVEKSPKGRFHRVCRYRALLVKMRLFRSLTGVSGVARTRRCIWRLTTIQGARLRGT